MLAEACLQRLAQRAHRPQRRQDEQLGSPVADGPGRRLGDDAGDEVAEKHRGTDGTGCDHHPQRTEAST